MKSRLYSPACLLLLLLTPFLAPGCEAVDDPSPDSSAGYDFQGPMSSTILANYLSHAVTQGGLVEPRMGANIPLSEELRMLKNLSAKFIGRAASIWIWESPSNPDYFFQQVETQSLAAHKEDPQFLLQAAIFECIAINLVNSTSVPDWVFQNFGLSTETRNFSYEAMLFPDGYQVDEWGNGYSIPDITQIETRMWFYYLAKRYIDSGIEAIHFGQVERIGASDWQSGWSMWADLLGRIRAYATSHARRAYVLLDGHTYGMVREGRLLLDFHSFPLRPVETLDQNGSKKAILKQWEQAIYGKSLGGLHPLGFATDSNYVLAEFDNYGISSAPGISDGETGIDCWGWDEITWFTLQPSSYRDEFLQYAWSWMSENFLVDGKQNYFLQPATRRAITPGAAPPILMYVPGETYSQDYFSSITGWPEFSTTGLQNGEYPLTVSWNYRANSQSDACPAGFGQEETIKALFSQ